MVVRTKEGGEDVLEGSARFFVLGGADSDLALETQLGDDGKAGTYPEDGLPTVGRRHGRCDDAAQGSAQAVARGIDCHRQATEAEIRVFADQDGDADEHAADADAGENTEDEEQSESRGEGRGN